jgi:hypothetical protein
MVRVLLLQALLEFIIQSGLIVWSRTEKIIHVTYREFWWNIALA